MPLAVSLRFDFVDVKNKKSFTKIRVPNGFTLSQYVEAAQAFAQILTNLSNGSVTNASVTFGLDLAGLGLSTVASGLADVYQKARFQFSTVASGFRAFFRIPTFSETKVVYGSDAIDDSDIDVAAFITAMENGVVVTGGTISPCDMRENDIAALQFAREIHRKKS